MEADKVDISEVRRAKGWAIWLDRLSPVAREWLKEAKHSEPTVAEPPRPTEVGDRLAVRYGLFEVRENEYPTLKVFPSAESLAQYLGQLDGTPIVICPFHGIPLAVTKGPRRYLLLPDGATAMTIPQYEGERIQTVPADDSLPAVQEDGNLCPRS